MPRDLDADARVRVQRGGNPAQDGVRARREPRAPEGEVDPGQHDRLRRAHRRHDGGGDLRHDGRRVARGADRTGGEAPGDGEPQLDQARAARHEPKRDPRRGPAGRVEAHDLLGGQQPVAHGNRRRVDAEGVPAGAEVPVGELPVAVRRGDFAVVAPHVDPGDARFPRALHAVAIAVEPHVPDRHARLHRPDPAVAHPHDLLGRADRFALGRGIRAILDQIAGCRHDGHLIAHRAPRPGGEGTGREQRELAPVHPDRIGAQRAARGVAAARGKQVVHADVRDPVGPGVFDHERVRRRFAEADLEHVGSLGERQLVREETDELDLARERRPVGGVRGRDDGQVPHPDGVAQLARDADGERDSGGVTGRDVPEGPGQHAAGHRGGRLGSDVLETRVERVGQRDVAGGGDGRGVAIHDRVRHQVADARARGTVQNLGEIELGRLDRGDHGVGADRVGAGARAVRRRGGVDDHRLRRERRRAEQRHGEGRGNPREAGRGGPAQPPTRTWNETVPD